MGPKFTVKKTAWSLTGTIFLGVLFCWLIFPLIWMICKIVTLKSYTAKIYDDRIEYTQGVFNKQNKTVFLKKVIGVNYNQSAFGQIAKYGDIHVNGVGIDYTLTGIRDANKIYDYFQLLVRQNNDLKQVVAE